MKHNVAENKERRSRQRFCKTVCCLVLSVDLAELDCSVVNELVQEPKAHCKVFSCLGTKKAITHVNECGIVFVNSEGAPGLSGA